MNVDDPKFTAYALGELEDLTPAECAEIEALIAQDPAAAAEAAETKAFAARLRAELPGESAAALQDDQRAAALKALAQLQPVDAETWDSDLENPKLENSQLENSELADQKPADPKRVKPFPGRSCQPGGLPDRSRGVERSDTPGTHVPNGCTPEGVPEATHFEHPLNGHESAVAEKKIIRFPSRMTVYSMIAACAAIAISAGLYVREMRLEESRQEEKLNQMRIELANVEGLQRMATKPVAMLTTPQFTVTGSGAGGIPDLDHPTPLAKQDRVFRSVDELTLSPKPQFSGSAAAPAPPVTITMEPVIAGSSGPVPAGKDVSLQNPVSYAMATTPAPAAPAAGAGTNLTITSGTAIQFTHRSEVPPSAPNNGPAQKALEAKDAISKSDMAWARPVRRFNSPPSITDDFKAGTGDSDAVRLPGPHKSFVVEPFNTNAFDALTENAFLAARENPLSTFSIDVDTASYAIVRRYLGGQQLPPKGAVRIEELLNYFTYDYPQPQADVPFSATMEVAACPWAPDHRLVRIGLKGQEIPKDQRPPSNLVFLIDVSGSMFMPNKLPLVKQSLGLLIEQLGPKDQVAIVVYAGNSGCVLEPTHDKEAMREAIHRLEAGGSTNGARGIQQAYQLAEQSFIKGGTNRVILATDGDWNVGTTNQSALLDMIAQKAKSGVFLTVLGFGLDNLKDSMLVKLADRGNGHYFYIDTLLEAKKVFVEQLSSTLVTIAKDVKIQVEFNPAQVGSYRLIGYEKRLMAKEDFNNDKKDAGEIGAGHTVTALYEVVPAGQEQPPLVMVDKLKYQPAQPAATAATPGTAGAVRETIRLKPKVIVPPTGSAAPVAAAAAGVVPATGTASPVPAAPAASAHGPHRTFIVDSDRGSSQGPVTIDIASGNIMAAEKALPAILTKEMLTLKLRYKAPDGDVSKLLEFPLTDPGTPWEKSSPDFRFAAAVAGYGMLLRDSEYRGQANWSAVGEWAREGLGEDHSGYRTEFLSLLEKAKALSR